jgi:hypothetical protein
MADYSASDLINATAVDFAAVLDWVDSSLSEPLLQPGRDSSDQQIQQALDEENFSTMHSISQSNYTQ